MLPGPPPAACMVISFARSPWILTLPAKNAAMPACGSPETKISFAVA